MIKKLMFVLILIGFLGCENIENRGNQRRTNKQNKPIKSNKPRILKETLYFA